MKPTITEQFLLALADLSDANQHIRSIQNFQALLMGDSDLRKNHKWMVKFIENSKERKRLHNAFTALKRRGFLKKGSSKNIVGYILTPKAQQRIIRLQIKSHSNKMKKLPRDESLMVFFDIPETSRKKRNEFRYLLQKFGFERLQKSIWITPFDVYKEVGELIKDLFLEKYVEMLIVKRFKNKKKNKIR